MMIETKQTKRARTRDQILIAAQDVLIEQGAGALSIKLIAERAGLVHGSFYNYYSDTNALLDGLADLVLTTHAAAVSPVRAGLSDPVQLFAATTRQTLRLAQGSPRVAALLFDSGIPIDRLLTALREPLRADLKLGAKAGAFVIQSMDVAITIVAGSMISLAADLHRRRAKAAAIDDVTAQLLRMLGVSPAKAKSAANADLGFAPMPSLPLSWKALGLAAPENSHAA